jgi:chaperonin GroEL
MNEISVELERATHESDVDALRERRARLSSKLAVIRVGGATAVEGKEKLRRTEGSLSAARAAMSEGIVPGGGTALLRAERALEDAGTDGEPRCRHRRRAGRAGRSPVLDRVERRLRRAGVVDQVRAMPPATASTR